MGAWLNMWTRKAAFTLVAGLSLILIGLMISNFQMMILGFTFIAFITVNSWMSGHGDIEVQRTLSADNLYKGDDLYVELLVINRSLRRTQTLEVFDNVPHEMKLRSGLNQMRLDLKPGNRPAFDTSCVAPCVGITPSDRSCATATRSIWGLKKCGSTTTRTSSCFHRSRTSRKPPAKPDTKDVHRATTLRTPVKDPSSTPSGICPRRPVQEHQLEGVCPHGRADGQRKVP